MKQIRRYFNFLPENQFPNTDLYFSIATCTSFCIVLSGFFSCQNESNNTLFRLLSPEQTGIDFSNALEEDDTFNIIEYLYFYNGGGVAVGDINNDGYPDIYFSSNRHSNKLYLNLGNTPDGKLRFKDVTDGVLSGMNGWSTGVNMIDINADGWLDIYLCQVGGYKQFRGKNQLFINQGCNLKNGELNEPCLPSFIEDAAGYGLDYGGFASQSAFFDYDLDGDLDMYLLCHSVHSSESYRDTASTRLRNHAIGDKFFENRTGEVSDTLLKFVEVSEKAGIFGGIAGYGLGLAIGDIDKNGYPDIYVGNDFHENDFLYLNQGNGTFKESSTRSTNHTSYFSMGNDLGDVNNDGWLDLLTLDMKPNDEILFKSAQGPDPYDIYRFKRSFGYHHQFPQNMLQINQGENSGMVRFSERAQMMGISSTDWSWSALIADLDLDGWKDLYITNGIPHRPNNLDYLKFISNQEIQKNASNLAIVAQMPSGKISNYVFSNQSGKCFRDETRSWGMERPSVSHGAAYADFDRDGDLDLVVNNLNEPAFFYENLSEQFSERNYLTIKFKGPEKNPFGVGTSVFVYSGASVQYQELYITKGWLSGVDHSLTFGLGTNKIVDSIVVAWPDSRSEVLKNIEANQVLDLDFKNAFLNAALSGTNHKSNKIFSNDNPQETFVHQENHFFDNTREPLIPYLLSTQGPRLAVADVNGDHLQDFYIGGASGQVGALFLQKSNGTFTRGDSTGFLVDVSCEDTGLAFLDVDGDGDQDLYIGSGGNQYHKDPDHLGDRLYLNDGQGNFQKSIGLLPDIYEQTSCIKPHDFDADGDEDLFVGSRNVSLFYGRFPDSYLLINDGNGHFRSAIEDLIDLSNLGMVADAVWTDVDQDGSKDLVVIGDWMPLTVFHHQAGRFVQRSPQAPSFGWWNTVLNGDIDRDGDEDLILGNLGLNSNLQASPEQPVRLYLNDFDTDLTPDPVVTYFRQNKEYPILGLDLLAGQMVYLKKKFRSYDDFARKTIQEVFTDEQLNRAQIRQVTQFQSVIAYNDGKGNFLLEDLPAGAQISSVNAILILDINHDQINDLFLAGNFFDLQPAIGRMDASYGTLLLGSPDGKFTEADNRNYNVSLDGQIRDLKMIETNRGKMILVAKNNAPLEFLTINPEL